MEENDIDVYERIRLFILVIGGVFLAIVVIRYFTDENEIYNNRGYSVGRIVDYSNSGTTYFVEFEYFVNDTMYTSVHAIEKLNCDDCIGKKYAVIYSTKNPQKGVLLATDLIYNKFDLKIPDTKEIE